MSTSERDSSRDQGRLLALLEHLLATEVTDLRTAMERAAQHVAEQLAADKVDVFLYDSENEALVAIGTSQTPMGRRERELGLDRLPIAEGGRTVEALQTGKSYLTRHSDQEGGEPRPLIEALGVRSSINMPLELTGERRGVLLVSSATPEFFSEHDLHFVEAVAHWVGLVAYRLAYVEHIAARATEESLRGAAEEIIGILTPRQQEVAGLVAAGLSNAEIARRLVLTPGTVANHMEHILRRLGFRSRTQIGIWAAERGLRRPRGESGSDAS